MNIITGDVNRLYNGVIWDMTIDEFQKGILNGTYNDKTGTAYIVINNLVQKSYSVYIDRRCVTKAGSIVSLRSLFKEYGAQKLRIQFWEKKIRIPSLETYRDSKKKNH